MSKERYDQIIDEVYKDYVKTSKPNLDWKYISQPEFIFWVKTNDNFSKKWGLKIEEKTLDLKERQSWLFKNKGMFLNNEFCDEVDSHKNFNHFNVPHKLITLTYNNETIEVYD